MNSDFPIAISFDLYDFIDLCVRKRQKIVCKCNGFTEGFTIYSI